MSTRSGSGLPSIFFRTRYFWVLINKKKRLDRPCSLNLAGLENFHTYSCMFRATATGHVTLDGLAPYFGYPNFTQSKVNGAFRDHNSHLHPSLFPYTCLLVWDLHVVNRRMTPSLIFFFTFSLFEVSRDVLETGLSANQYRHHQT